MITNSQSRTNIQEIADGIYRINTPIAIPGGPGQFSFNQYLIVDDFADRPPRALADSEDLPLGRHRVCWFDTPHVPHAWECGLMMESSTRTFFCGDLFTQGGAGEVALTESDILGPSEDFRKPLDYFAHAPQTATILERLALEQPATLACMHGSAWHGNGGALLRSLAAALEE